TLPKLCEMVSLLSAASIKKRTGNLGLLWALFPVLFWGSHQLFLATLPDVLVYPARDSHQYGHAIMVVDVAKNRAGKVAILCVEGNTPARDMHILRNSTHPFQNPWFILDGDERNIRISVFHFGTEELRHY
ncbi:MAG: hypothetical protein IKN99_07435, partial [Bacteroidales bacterium]|nr:hypothetical protein [Bacteroidales bacterium]